jgi:hypothetical protein
MLLFTDVAVTTATCLALVYERDKLFLSIIRNLS